VVKKRERGRGGRKRAKLRFSLFMRRFSTSYATALIVEKNCYSFFSFELVIGGYRLFFSFLTPAASLAEDGVVSG
jgi:hypothetical protein